ncbi:MAG: putative peptidoglycan glycosyltransferase FtsW [Synergistaceae bacterium]|nr:putative peptidoglycan glycosyltransferase FtsW [Synergistaceae bacterium]
MSSEGRGYNGSFRVNPFLWFIPLVLSGIGILMITSTTSPSSFAYTGTPFQMGIKQFQWLAIALFGMVAVYAVPLRVWYRFSAPLLITAWTISWFPLIPGIGATIGGARRWIQLPGLSISIQPGELLCLALALHLAKILSREDRDQTKAFISVCVLMAFSSVPLLCQPDLGTTILVFLISMGMYVERVGFKLPIITGAVIIAAASPSLVFGTSYRMRRISAFINPWNDPLDTGFQAIQGLIAFANGGFWGTGMGHGFQKLNYLPAAYTDFIYAAIGEELGLVGTVGVLMLFAFWIAQTRRIYYNLEDKFRSSLTWGVTLTVVLPLIINVAGVTKLMPLTGMPLPFVSYGGTSLLMMWSRVGMLMRLEKESYLEGSE